jgi:NAD(P)-dependent dehydrogenase (short-subunit alcohol dehydrogenase family)
LVRTRALEGKVAIVTGAGQGLGRSEALLFAGLGAAVVVNDRGGPAGDRFADRVVCEIEAAGGRAAANHADVSSWTDAAAMVAQAVDTFGGLDILLCNAGIVRDRMIYNLAEEEWDDVIRVHLKGHAAPTKFAAQYWRNEHREGRPRGGRIIYTSSEAGLYGHIGQANYSAAKSGVVGLGLTVARELEKYGVTVNIINPRGRTPMTEGTFGQFSQVSGFDEWDPDNVPPWIAFLASDAAANITGQCFVVYGGLVAVADAWPITASIDKKARWTVGELMEEANRLFPGLEGGVKPFPTVEIPV